MADWIKKVESELKAKQDDYEKRKLIMTEQTSSEALAEINKLQKEISDYRDKKFGANGELFQKQNEVMKPIQNKVFTIIQQIATEEGLDLFLTEAATFFSSLPTRIWPDNKSYWEIKIE